MPPPDLFRTHARLPLIAPSILSADFAHMGRDCGHVLRPTSEGGAGADLLHLDVMDGHFVPNLTMGPDLCRCLRAALPSAFLDVHLMVTDPLHYFAPFAKAGANHVTFHVEVLAPRDIANAISQAHALGMSAGLALNPPTPVEQVLPHLDGAGDAALDLVLVMSVNPGFSGQAFIDSVLAKTRTIRQHARPSQRIQMDGGIGPAQSEAVRSAGCDVLVAASAIFKQPEAARGEVVAALRGQGRA